jgi:hypothetical protein
LQSHHSHAEDKDDGKFMDSDEDNDLNGNDTSALKDIFTVEVCSMYCDYLCYQCGMICLQHPSWASPKGPSALFDDDDDVIDVKGKAPCKTTSVLFLHSDSDKSPMIKEPEKPKQGPAMCKLLGSIPPQGRPGQASKPVKSRCQEAHNFEVFFTSSFLIELLM